MFAYCDNNAVNNYDPSGYLLIANSDCGGGGAILVLFFASAAGYVGSQALGTGFVGANLISMGLERELTFPQLQISIPKTKTKEKAEVLEKTKDLILPKDTIIYRYGGTNPGNLTPRQTDIFTGLSFSTIPKPGAAMTTIRTLNATGIVNAVQDGVTHVSVKPVGATVQDWVNAGSSSIWTTTVKSLVIKWDGGF